VIAAPDVFVLRRVSAGRFVHLGGEGRGEGWAGIVESSLEEDAAVAEALRTVRPVRIDRDSSERIFGPYYARFAAIVPVSQDAVVVFGSPDGPIGEGDDELLAAANSANDTVEAPAQGKQLADELELLDAVRAAIAVPPDPVEIAMEALAGVAAQALSCELGIMYVAQGQRLAVSEHGWSLGIPRDDVIQSLRNVLGGSAFPFCVQDARTAPPPGALVREEGIRSYYLLELTGLANGVLFVAHTDVLPRGFTQLCRRLGARVAEVASAVVGVGLTREWTAAESVRLQTEFAALEPQPAR
jgi:hypothetical protein